MPRGAIARICPKNVIPAEAPGVRELVLALLDLWPSFEWERLVLDPPPGWLGIPQTKNVIARKSGFCGRSNTL
jgi:hypothetical protein